MGVVWLPAASADDLPPPYTIVVDRMTAPVDSGSGVEFHAGQAVQYRVRAYDKAGKLTSCNPAANNQPQVLTHNPATGTVVQQSWGSTNADGSSAVNVIMGKTAGAGFLEVSCGSAVKKVLLSNDGEPMPAGQNPGNPNPNGSPSLLAPGQAQNGAASEGLAGAPPADQQNPAPDADADSGGHALLIAGIVAAAVVGAVAIAAVASSSSSSGGSTCSGGSHQCSPPNSTICCPDGTTIYCTNNNTCTNQTLNNFGDVCGNGNNSSADGC
jgi:hypothetical protein